MSSLATLAPPLRVLIVEDDSLVGLGLKATLERLGHEVIAHASNTEDALSHFSGDAPDLVLLDIRLTSAEDDYQGLALADRFAAIRAVPMIVISAYSDAELVHRATIAGVFGYLVKPVTAETLAAQIEVATQRARDHHELREQNATLCQQLQNRKLVERAKGVLMKRLNLDEPDAHKRLQLESQKRRIPLADLAQKILESDDLFSV